MAKRKLSKRQRWRIEKIQQERTERAARRAEKTEQSLQQGALGPEQQGRVVAHFGTLVEVEALPSGHRVSCHFRANIDSLVTGDRVVFCTTEPDGGVVVAREPRNSALKRPDKFNQIKTIAANIDYIIVVFAPQPEPHRNLIDRYLVAAEQVNIAPVILLNKADRLDPDAELLDWLDEYQRLGYRTCTASARMETGLDDLNALLQGSISVFVGQSGVGKSSLINALLPDAQAKVGALSEAATKGTHTTTTATLFHLPGGGDIIDSPGIREFGLWHLQAHELIEGFCEFRPYLGQCKFRNCQHEDEPGCALREAVTAGHIDPRRWDSYQRLLGELGAH